MSLRLGLLVNCRAIAMAALLFFSLPQFWLEATWQPAELVSGPTFVVSPRGGPVLKVTPQGNALSIWTFEDAPPFTTDPTIYSSFYTRGIGWSEPQLVSSTALNSANKPLFTAQGDPTIAITSSNYAVAVWEGEYSDLITDPYCVYARISSSGNGVWNLPDPGAITILCDTSGDFFSENVNITMNETKTALAAWRETDLSQDPMPEYTTVNFLVGGVWTGFFRLEADTGSHRDGKPYPKINQDGNAVVTWQAGLGGFARGVKAATYKASTGTWTTVRLDADHSGNITINPRCGIDDQGRAIAVWGTRDKGIRSAFFNGSSWGPIEILDTTTDDSFPDPDSCDVIMDSQGNCIAVWNVGEAPSFQNKLFYSFRPINGSWGLREYIGSEDSDYDFQSFQSQEPLANDLDGNAIMVWRDRTARTILSSYGSFDPEWGLPELVDPHSTIHRNVGLASCGFAIALWFQNDQVWAAINGNVADDLIPKAAIFKKCVDSFAMQKRCCNILSWKPAGNPCILFYKIYRNGKLIGTVSSREENKFVDCDICCRKKNTYTISSVNVFGVESAQVPVVPSL